MRIPQNPLAHGKRKATTTGIIIAAGVLAGTAVGITAASALDGPEPDQTTSDFQLKIVSEDEYKVTPDGLTYQQVGEHPSGAEPDLVLVYTTDEELGYAESDLLDHPEGWSAPVTAEEVDIYNRDAPKTWEVPVWSTPLMTEQIGVFKVGIPTEETTE